MLMVKKNKTNVIFPFNEISNDVLLSLFSDHVVTDSRSRCSDCRMRTKVGASVVYCCECLCYFHLTCAKVKKKRYPTLIRLDMPKMHHERVTFQ